MELHYCLITFWDYSTIKHMLCFTIFVISTCHCLVAIVRLPMQSTLYTTQINASISCCYCCSSHAEYIVHYTDQCIHILLLLLQFPCRVHCTLHRSVHPYLVAIVTRLRHSKVSFGLIYNFFCDAILK